MKLLVVEDDAKTSRFLRQGLHENGYDVSECADGELGLTQALTGDYALILLDIVMPVRDGLSMLAEFRRHDLQTPVILLTAREPIEERVEGLGLGADDYIVKPFSFAELLARVKTVLQRAAPADGHIREIADLRLDLRACKATRGSRKIDLTMKEFLLLDLLIRNQGNVLSRQFIAEQIWGTPYDSDRNFIDVTIRRLRGKIDDGHADKLIQTSRGFGYVIGQV